MSKDIKEQKKGRQKLTISMGHIDDTQHTDYTNNTDDKCKVEYGDMCFLQTIRKLEIERIDTFDLPTRLQILFTSTLPKKSYKMIYIDLIKKSASKLILYNAFIKTCDVIAYTEKAIISYTIQHRSKKINVSLPELTLDRSDNINIVFNPLTLESVINKLVEYMNKLNISCLVKTQTISFDHEPPISIDLNYVIPEVHIKDSIDLIEAKQLISDLYNHEITVMSYICSIERYQYEAIKLFISIQDICSTYCKALL
jgi:hypothetical protein